MLLVVDLFVAEITKQKLSPEQTSILRLQIFSFFAGCTDSRYLYHPNEKLESCQYKSTALNESSTLSGCQPERELKMKRETELIPESDGEWWLRQPL